MNLPQLTDPWHYYTYRYDQLNRLTRTDVYKATGTAYNVTYVNDYKEFFGYDPNGNITTVNRYANAGTQMDNMVYHYNTDASGKLTNNRLNYIADAVAAGAYPNDIDNQKDKNYQYDAIGNLTTDSASNVSGINWSVYGKIQSLTNSSGTISYSYDPAGQRVTKASGGITTYYVRDAQGTTLATYNNAHSATNWMEQDLYGSSRLGMWQPAVKLGTDSSYIKWDTVGKKVYELTNHLGNVLATITDKRLGTGTGTTVNYFKPDVATEQEYYPFGGLMPGRTYTQVGSYRYGFNGKENDNDVKGVGDQQDYGERIYDPRVGRFLSVDPLSGDYPFYTPYQISGNMPIFSMDIDGLEPEKIINKAESLLYTPYEFGGKTPAPNVIGLLKDHRDFWEKELKPQLQVISDKYHGKTKRLTDEQNQMSLGEIKEMVYKQFVSLTHSQGSLGIDCSGFVYKSYSEDRELLFNVPKLLETGSDGQLAAFNKLAKQGKAVVHDNFNLISQGDFIHTTGHVMIATGRVKVDKSGNVVQFETIEAASTDKGSIIRWRKVSKDYQIGHPYRKTDKVTSTSQNSILGFIEKIFQINDNSGGDNRLKGNLKQTVVN